MLQCDKRLQPVLYATLRFLKENQTENFKHYFIAKLFLQNAMWISIHTSLRAHHVLTTQLGITTEVPQPSRSSHSWASSCSQDTSQAIFLIFTRNTHAYFPCQFQGMFWRNQFHSHPKGKVVENISTLDNLHLYLFF